LLSEKGFKHGDIVERKSDALKGNIGDIVEDNVKIETAGGIVLVAIKELLNGNFRKVAKEEAPEKYDKSLAPSVAPVWKIVCHKSLIITAIAKLEKKFRTVSAKVQVYKKPAAPTALRKYDAGELHLVPVCTSVSHQELNKAKATYKGVATGNIPLDSVQGVDYWLTAPSAKDIAVPFWHLRACKEERLANMRFILSDHYDIPLAVNTKDIAIGDELRFYELDWPHPDVAEKKKKAVNEASAKTAAEVAAALSAAAANSVQPAPQSKRRKI
jgi:hypothetical protein